MIITSVLGVILIGSALTINVGLSRENNWDLLVSLYNSNSAEASAPTKDANLVFDTTPDNQCEIKKDEEKVSIVNYLSNKGEKPHFSDRAILAKEMGISNYVGTAKQNLTLLEELKSKDSTCNNVGINDSKKVPTVINIIED
jgi:hypothetical protein